MGLLEPSRATGRGEEGSRWVLVRAYQEPPAQSPWSPPDTLWYGYPHSPHFTSGETEAQSSYSDCPSSHSTKKSGSWP